MCTKLRFQSPKGSNHSEYLFVDGRIILKLLINKYRREVGLDSSGSVYRPVAGSYKHGNGP
jgi:hypothetical protein